MAKSINAAFALALSVFVICASLFISVSGARDIAAQAPMLMSDNSPTQAPKLPAQCKISEMCGNNLAEIIVAKTLPTIQDDSTCCQEIIQSSKYCWDKVMEIVEDPNVPALAHLYPWADKFWNSCVDIEYLRYCSGNPYCY